MTRFDWDQNKNRSNLRKHGISFELASTMFDDPNALSLRDESQAEERWLTMGLGSGAMVMVVAHTWEERGDETIIRIISARKATRREREAYAKENKRPDRFQ